MQEKRSRCVHMAVAGYPCVQPPAKMQTNENQDASGGVLAVDRWSVLDARKTQSKKKERCAKHVTHPQVTVRHAKRFRWHQHF